MPNQDPDLLMPPKEVSDAAQLIVRWMNANSQGHMWEYLGLCDRRFAFRLHETTALLKHIVADNETRWTI